MKIKHKLPRKVAEERDLNLGEIIYLDLISHKKPIYGGSKNWIRIQDSDTKQKWYFSTKAKSYFTEKVTPFLNKTNTMKKNVKTIQKRQTISYLIATFGPMSFKHPAFS